MTARTWVAAIALLASARVGAAQHAEASKQGSVTKPTSYALIDRALAAKEITHEHAYTYRVFAAFGDTRLPARFRADNADL
jgi:hypothetical protein